jgi:hypothetical protein
LEGSDQKEAVMNEDEDYGDPTKNAKVTGPLPEDGEQDSINQDPDFSYEDGEEDGESNQD